MSNTKGAYKSVFLDKALREALAQYLANYPGETFSSLIQGLLRYYFAHKEGRP